ncbi:hypothetical protein DelCs14_4400 [Delftia sp. Cs1-4]|uniref:hypothetical protein n=1 Tax=Delftia sp. (strain Cs1-4) TaxID=742013 RepID=UPI00020E89EE|nr:hypothetical protein [Delftia sp. Cs1-4]AEF91379.1 hypothetical protein DelCs14_4400 [Delftia sp. Cs1-4]
MEINWQVFQAAAALVGSKTRAEGIAMDQVINSDFLDTYLALLRVAKQIEKTPPFGFEPGDPRLKSRMEMG